ncbi:Ras-related protein Rab-4B [Clonorchis sinensis]|uniref:Ras-related protein Rab-4B n=1 Tax=Clonorchis sinensis TaxID=79923 RepID=G7Y426_CLOSI|nr:Ras-related protein Rab-4B [Clonorchis sinensis]
METYTHLLKFLIVGDAATGKTCLLRWFLAGNFKEESLHTIGVEFGTKVVQVDGKPVKLQIWDTAGIVLSSIILFAIGQERFQCVTRSYYRGAAGALVVYDVNDRGSFNSVRKWISSVRDLALPNICIILVGNKVDLAEDSRQQSVLRRLASDVGSRNCLRSVPMRVPLNLFHCYQNGLHCTSVIILRFLHTIYRFAVSLYCFLLLLVTYCHFFFSLCSVSTEKNTHTSFFRPKIVVTALS